MFVFGNNNVKYSKVYVGANLRVTIICISSRHFNKKKTLKLFSAPATEIHKVITIENCSTRISVRDIK